MGKGFCVKPLKKPNIPTNWGAGAVSEDYLTKKIAIENLPSDPRLLGGIKQPDGVLLCFDDGSSLLSLDANFTEEQSREISLKMMPDSGNTQ